MKRMIGRVIMFAFGIGCLCNSGWRFVLGESSEFLMYYGQDFVWNKLGILFRVDNVYYGICMTGKPIDSPVLSWVLLGAGLGTIVMAFASKNYWDKHIDRKR